MPHFGHAIALAIFVVMADVINGVLIGVRAIRSRAGVGRLARVWAALSSHTVRDIDPEELVNMNFFLAREWTQAAPQSFCLNDAA